MKTYIVTCVEHIGDLNQWSKTFKDLNEALSFLGDLPGLIRPCAHLYEATEVMFKVNVSITDIR